VPGPPLIAVFEDDPWNLALIECALTEEGYRVAALSQRTNISRLTVSERPALIIMDTSIGRGTLDWRAIGATLPEPGTDRIPVIICTADSTFLRRNEEVLLAKGYALVKKPFDVDELLCLVSSTLDRTCSDL
jgi:CheY-like chemotaxis protein